MRVVFFHGQVVGGVGWWPTNTRGSYGRARALGGSSNSARVLSVRLPATKRICRRCLLYVVVAVRAFHSSVLMTMRAFPVLRCVFVIVVVVVSVAVVASYDVQEPHYTVMMVMVFPLFRCVVVDVVLVSVVDVVVVVTVVPEYTQEPRARGTRRRVTESSFSLRLSRFFHFSVVAAVLGLDDNRRGVRQHILVKTEPASFNNLLLSPSIHTLRRMPSQRL